MHLSAMGTLDRKRYAWQGFKLDGLCVQARLDGLAGRGAAGQDIWHLNSSHVAGIQYVLLHPR